MFLQFLLIWLLVGAFSSVHAGNSLNEKDKGTQELAYIAIIIDDLGYKLKQDQRAIKLPGSVTLSFLPQTPHIKALTKIAHTQGNEIMLHLPMQATDSHSLGPGALTNDMNKIEFKISLLKSILSVPYVKGINNHMGSLITSQKAPMNWLMEEIARTGLFFVDSRTTVNTLAELTAKQHQISNTRRDVFLDHEPNRWAIENQFDELIKIAKKEGSAVAIGHPIQQTLAVLEEKIPLLQEYGIKLVPVSELIQKQVLIAKTRQKRQWKHTASLTQNHSHQLNHSLRLSKIKNKDREQ